MPTFEIVRDDERAKKTGGRCVFTFLIDGSPTLRWYPQCTTPPLPPDYFVKRAIERLKLGRSNVLGGPTVAIGSQVIGQLNSKEPIRAKVTQGKPKIEKAVLGSGKEKQREVQVWVAELDGEAIGEFPSQAAAKCAVACAAWKHGGKLAHMKKAQEQLSASNPGKNCKVFACPKRHKIVASVDGKEVHVGISPSGDIVV